MHDSKSKIEIWTSARSTFTLALQTDSVYGRMAYTKSWQYNYYHEIEILSFGNNKHTLVKTILLPEPLTLFSLFKKKKYGLWQTLLQMEQNYNSNISRISVKFRQIY